MRLGFGVGVVDVGTQGGVADAADGAISAAALFLAAYGPHGMVLNFDSDASISINDAADLLDFESSGQVSGGALVGPGSKLTNTAPSVKLTEQADGFLKFQAHNLCLWSEDLTDASWSKPGAGLTAPSVDTLRETAITGSHRFVQAITVSFPGESIIELKADGRDKVGVYISGAGAHVGVNLTDGIIGTISSGFGAYASGATIEALDDGWFRVSLPFNAMAIFEIYLLSAWTPGGPATSNYAGDTSKGIKARRAHVRRTPSASDYIATTTAAVYDLPYVYSGGVRQGIAVEPAATNLALWSNDFTNASWTKSNMTTALTATGPDGVANSASTLTATAGNATALQAITSASSSRLTSVYIKRRTGSGNIDLTQDNGTTWTTQTVTSSWTRVALAAVTSTNPTVGIRIATSGDAVDVWCFDHETGTVATSPIITYGAAVARAADSPEITTSLFPYNVSEGTLYIKAIVPTIVTNGRFLDLNNNSSTIRVADIYAASATSFANFKTVDSSSHVVTSAAVAGIQRIAARYKENDYHSAYNGVLGTPDTVTPAMETATMLEIGHLANASQLPMIVQQVAYFPDAKANATLQALGA